MISNCDEKRCEALLTDTSVGSTGGGHSSGVSSLVDGGADPVDSGISSNRLVRRVDQNDLVELVQSTSVIPIIVSHSQWLRNERCQKNGIEILRDGNDISQIRSRGSENTADCSSVSSGDSGTGEWVGIAKKSSTNKVSVYTSAISTSRMTPSATPGGRSCGIGRLWISATFESATAFLGSISNARLKSANDCVSRLRIRETIERTS